MEATRLCAESRVQFPQATDRFERGWRAWLTAEENEDPVEVVVLCATCSAREFGEVTPSET